MTRELGTWCDKDQKSSFKSVESKVWTKIIVYLNGKLFIGLWVPPAINQLNCRIWITVLSGVQVISMGLLFRLHWGFEYQTSLVLGWSEVVRSLWLMMSHKKVHSFSEQAFFSGACLCNGILAVIWVVSIGVFLSHFCSFSYNGVFFFKC